jgi:hypothetical protein
MATTTRPLTGPPDPGENDFTKSLKFQTLLTQIKGRGTSRLNAQDRLSIAELARTKETHHDPRIRAQLQRAYDEVARAHLEFCLRLPRTST